VFSSQAGDPIWDRERPHGHRVTEPGHIEMEGISLTPWGRRERDDLKRGNPGGCQQTTDFQVSSSLEEFPSFTFTFCFPNKTLLKSLTFPAF
jgi:hypothetical protein